jgi:hypothetical protein
MVSFIFSKIYFYGEQKYPIVKNKNAKYFKQSSFKLLFNFRLDRK